MCRALSAPPFPTSILSLSLSSMEGWGESFPCIDLPCTIHPRQLVGLGSRMPPGSQPIIVSFGANPMGRSSLVLLLNRRAVAWMILDCSRKLSFSGLAPLLATEQPPSLAPRVLVVFAVHAGEHSRF